ncbi:MAG: Maff2 family protein [Ruminococcus sp.]|nr:Maff2 family protein [Ruminococcus sp.]
MENLTFSAVSTTAPKHRWLKKGSKFAKKAVLSLTTLCCMVAMFGTTGEVDTSSFITTACTVLKSVICLIGGGVGVWGVVNLLEGYGNDNRAMRS